MNRRRRKHGVSPLIPRDTVNYLTPLVMPTPAFAWLDRERTVVTSLQHSVPARGGNDMRHSQPCRRLHFVLHCLLFAYSHTLCTSSIPRLWIRPSLLHLNSIHPRYITSGARLTSRHQHSSRLSYIVKCLGLIPSNSSGHSTAPLRLDIRRLPHLCVQASRHVYQQFQAACFPKPHGKKEAIVVYDNTRNTIVQANKEDKELVRYGDRLTTPSSPSRTSKHDLGLCRGLE